jgi:hypothetical protein
MSVGMRRLQGRSRLGRRAAFSGWPRVIGCLSEWFGFVSGSRRATAEVPAAQSSPSLVVEQVVVNDPKVEAIVWTPPARPFFEKQRECPQADSNR